MTRDARATWSKRVERWCSSGLTAREFAREVGVNPHTLVWWKWRLRNENGAGEVEGTAKGARFVEVVSPAASVMATVMAESGACPANRDDGDRMLELVLRDGLRIRVPAGFDTSTLQRMVAALEGR